MKDNLKQIISVMPSTPGVYQYFNADGKIIYVGKAKNLKRRVSSYFNKVHDSAKTNIFVLAESCTLLKYDETLRFKFFALPT